MAVPAGWFPNPSNPEEEVFWDGTNWSGDVRPLGALPSATEDDATGPSLDDVGAHPGANGADLESPSRPPMDATRKKRRTAIWVSLGVVIALLLGGAVTTAVVVQNVHAQQVAAEKAQARRLAEVKAKNEAEAKQAAAAAKAAADDAERESRKATVTQVEASVKKLAEEDISKGLLDGPVIGVTCNPVSGSTDDLSDPTTTFDCFVGNKDNGDGTQSGYFFNATVNWDSGEYTYGLGKSGG